MTEYPETAGAGPDGTPRIIAVANQKGGVGKTTTAINLGAALAEDGVRTVIIDLDPQGNASTGLGFDPQDRGLSIHDVMAGDANLGDAVRAAETGDLFLAPSSHELVSADMAMADSERRLWFLADALSGDDLRKLNAAYVLIDCPPSLNLLTLNAMVAAHSILVPLQAEFFALEGLSQLIRSMREVRGSANPQLHLEGVLLTMIDRRNNLSRQVEKDARQNLRKLVFETVIPRTVRLSEAPSHGMSALLYDKRSAGSLAYRSLAGEIRRNQAGNQRRRHG